MAKKFTDLMMVTALKQNGTDTYHHCVIRSTATNILRKTVNVNGEDRLLVEFSIPVSNRNKTLNNRLGTSFPVNGQGSDQDEVVWVRASAWGQTAERMVAYLERVGMGQAIYGDAEGRSSAKMPLIVMGSLNVGSYVSPRTGLPSLELRVFDFWATGAQRTQNGNSQNATAAPAAAPAASFPAMSEDGYFNLKDSDFAEMYDDDGDVPF